MIQLKKKTQLKKKKRNEEKKTYVENAFLSMDLAETKLIWRLKPVKARDIIKLTQSNNHTIYTLTSTNEENENKKIRKESSNSPRPAPTIAYAQH